MSTLKDAKRKSLRDKHLEAEAELRASALEKADQKVEADKLKENKS